MTLEIQSPYTQCRSSSLRHATSQSCRRGLLSFLRRNWNPLPKLKKLLNRRHMGQNDNKSPRPILAPSEVFWGERLQLAREFRGLTQEKLANAVAASPTLVRYCESGKKREPASDLVEAFASVLGFEPGFFYGRLTDIFKDDECSFRHRRTTPEKTKTQVRAHATLIAMVVERLRGVFRFPKLNVPMMRASSADEIEKAAEQCRIHWNLAVDGPLLHVGRAAEHAGIVIFPHLSQS